MESERPDALFRDPHARRLAGERGEAPTPTLAITEGLLVYLRPDQVASLAEGLAETPSVRWWLIALASPRMSGIVLLERI
jgi:O-methyltransferase involved in polyketide biosynthesis